MTNHDAAVEALQNQRDELTSAIQFHTERIKELQGELMKAEQRRDVAVNDLSGIKQTLEYLTAPRPDFSQITVTLDPESAKSISRVVGAEMKRDSKRGAR